MSDQSVSGPIPPYGVPIREAIASGDGARMREMSALARQWLNENSGHQSAAEVDAELRNLEAQLRGG